MSLQNNKSSIPVVLLLCQMHDIDTIECHMGWLKLAVSKLFNQQFQSTEWDILFFLIIFNFFPGRFSNINHPNIFMLFL